ncbi:MAG: DinB family protein [Candidatus Krumholzibacteria bacterium]|nr:DinB family protein [Candidatus Krumholzibacteria bacterium]
MKAPSDENSILARFAAGPESLAQALAGLRDADLDARPARGGWTIRQIVHHVTDGDDLWKSCIKMALGNEQGEFALAIKTPDGHLEQLPVGAVIEMQADHLEHHVERILAIRRELEDTAREVE